MATISPPPPCWPRAWPGTCAIRRRSCLRRPARYNQTPSAPPHKETAMANAQLQSVLDHIDADFDNSLARLFDLLRIKSISADPAFAEDCKKAADHLAKDIETLGFKAEVRPTAGHPAIVAKANGNAGQIGRASCRERVCVAVSERCGS